MQQFATSLLNADPLALLSNALRRNVLRANEAPEDVGPLLYSALRRDQQNDGAIERALRFGPDEQLLRIETYQPQETDRVRWRAPGSVNAIHSVRDGLTALRCTNALMIIDASGRAQTILAPRLTASEAFGETVMTGDAEGTVTFWSSFAQLETRVAAHRAEVTHVVFMMEAAYSCGADGTIVRWERSGEVWQVHSRFDAPAAVSAASMIGHDAAFGCRTGDILEIGADGTTTLHRGAHASAVTGIELRDDLLISAGGDRMLRACNMRLPRTAKKIDSGHAMGIGGMVARDDRQLVVATWALDHTLRIWHIDKFGSPSPKFAFELVGHKAAVTAAAFGLADDDEPWLITGSADGEVIRWDEEADPIASHHRHSGAVRAIAFRNKEIVTAGDDARIDRCDYKLAVVPDGGVSAAVSAAGAVGICIDGRPMVFVGDGWKESKFVATSIALHSRNQTMISWREGATEADSDVRQWGVFDRFAWPVVGCAWVGDMLVAVLAEGSVEFASGRPVHTNEHTVTVMVGAADGVIFGTDRGTVSKVGLEEPHILRIDAHTTRVTALAAYQTFIASASTNGDIAIWSMTVPVFRFRHHAQVSHLAFSTTTALLVSACEDNSAAIWDYRNGRRSATCVGHRDRITALVIDDRSKLIYTASLDRTVRAWDFEGVQRGIVYGDHPFSAMALIPNGVMPGEVLVGDDAGALYTLRYRRDEPEPETPQKQPRVRKAVKRAAPKKKSFSSRSSRRR